MMICTTTLKRLSSARGAGLSTTAAAASSAFSLHAIGTGVHGETGLGVMPERSALGLTCDVTAAYRVPDMGKVLDASAGWGHSAAIEASNPSSIVLMGRALDMEHTLRWGRGVGRLLGIDSETWVGSPSNASALYSWGLNRFKEVSESTVPFKKPQQIDLPCKAGDTVRRVSCSGGLTIALMESGVAYAIGANRYGQCGIGDRRVYCLEPLQVRVPSPIARLDTGFQHCVALTSSGAVYTWGKGLRGQLGLSRETERELEPVAVERIEGDVVDVAAGMNHTAAVTKDGSVWIWGKYQNPERHSKYKYFKDAIGPRRVDFPEGTRIASILCGQYSTVAVDEDGGVWQWGMWPDSAMERYMREKESGEEASQEMHGLERMVHAPQKVCIPKEYEGLKMSIAPGFGQTIATFPDSPKKTPISWGFDGHARPWLACENLSVKHVRQAHMHILLMIEENK